MPSCDTNQTLYSGKSGAQKPPNKWAATYLSVHVLSSMTVKPLCCGLSSRQVVLRRDSCCWVVKFTQKWARILTKQGLGSTHFKNANVFTQSLYFKVVSVLICGPTSRFLARFQLQPRFWELENVLVLPISLFNCRFNLFLYLYSHLFVKLS